ncbi:hypothetical protein WMY93_027732 [Mugilogobius chulae]|uniref:Uncharacterized protein n=1 Tax=Mugilogobius chulae TaxID=88201 RepID=A0AAW0N0K9_9GOBI
MSLIIPHVPCYFSLVSDRGSTNSCSRTNSKTTCFTFSPEVTFTPFEELNPSLFLLRWRFCGIAEPTFTLKVGLLFFGEVRKQVLTSVDALWRCRGLLPPRRLLSSTEPQPQSKTSSSRLHSFSKWKPSLYRRLDSQSNVSSSQLMAEASPDMFTPTSSRAYALGCAIVTLLLLTVLLIFYFWFNREAYPNADRGSERKENGDGRADFADSGTTKLRHNLTALARTS